MNLLHHSRKWCSLSAIKTRKEKNENCYEKIEREVVDRKIENGKWEREGSPKVHK